MMDLDWCQGWVPLQKKGTRQGIASQTECVLPRITYRPALSPQSSMKGLLFVSQTHIFFHLEKAKW